MVLLRAGWAMRAALAAALFVTPDLLLLDEVRRATQCDYCWVTDSLVIEVRPDGLGMALLRDLLVVQCATTVTWT
jgi:ABC-type transporter Mla maintaining outer membrane lipid asymmetry ATPase subunit MlaF